MTEPHAVSRCAAFIAGAGQHVHGDLELYAFFVASARAALDELEATVNTFRLHVTSLERELGRRVRARPKLPEGTP